MQLQRSLQEALITRSLLLVVSTRKRVNFNYSFQKTVKPFLSVKT